MNIYRSTLEKRWANVLDELNIEYEYETKSFDVRINYKKEKYIPDFYLPKQNIFIEVKAPHKWEGRGMEKARYIAEKGNTVMVCKENGKFFFLGNGLFGKIKEGNIYKCNDCRNYFFTNEDICFNCNFCDSHSIELFSSGEEGIPHWYNDEEKKWLFDEENYKMLFNTVNDENKNTMKNIHNHLEGVPETVKYTKELIKEMEKLFIKYPNMEEIKNYIFNYIKTLELRNDKIISFQPILIVGSPGCGKTAFATEFAKIVMKRNPVKIEMGNGITFMDICGDSRTFKGSECGLILKSMFSENPKPPIKNPVIVIDEFEKCKKNEHSCENVFYTLFEKKSSEIYTDNFFGVSIDASNINYIATANTIEGISKPIMNRMKVFNVRDYTKDELKNIVIPNIYSDWMKKENIKIERIPEVLSDEIIEEIIKRSNGEIRKIYAILTELLQEYMYFEENIQEYISLFTKNEIKNWYKLTNKIEFKNKLWKLEDDKLENFVSEIDEMDTYMNINEL